MSPPLKEIVVLGGPNGAGKTTAARVLLPQKLGISEFVNADEIARGLSPENVDGVALLAGRTMLARLQRLLRQDKSFAFETTCAGRGHAVFLDQAKNLGWRVTLIFLWLPSPHAALDRVAFRVREGGHNIPPELVVRRYWKGLSNLRQVYLPVSDIATIYDNSDGGRRLVAEKTPDQGLVISDQDIWSAIVNAKP